LLANNIIWHNRTFHITTGANPIPGAQSVVTLAPLLSQTASGGCPTGASYWDIGVYGDLGPGRSATPGSGYTLNPLFSILGDPGYTTAGSGNRTTTNVGVVKLACNGSRVPPEVASIVCTSSANAPGCAQNGNPQGGMSVPPGVPDINPFYPVFSLNPAATTDEGNNFINMFYGPLSMTNSAAVAGTPGYGVPISNYTLTQNSPAVNAITPGSSTWSLAPSTDFFGLPRPDAANGTTKDIGAVEFASAPNFLVQPTALTFSSTLTVTSAPQPVVVTNTGNTTLSIGGGSITFSPPSTQFQATPVGCGALAPAATCTINVTFQPTGLSTPNPRLATLNVNIGNGSAQAVALTGNIVTPTVTLSAPTAFPNQTLTTTSAPQTLTLTNTGTVQLTAINITITPISPTTAGVFTRPGGAAGGTCGATLPPPPGAGSSCTINITFTPTATGSRSATLSVNGAGLAAPLTATLTGTGIAPSTSGTLAPARTFNQNVGTTSASQPVTLTNTAPSGSGSLTITSIGFTGANPTDFAQTNTCGASLAAGNSTCTINVTFTPSATGARSANLSVVTSAGTLTAAMSGTGTQAAVTFSPAQPTGLVTGAADRTVKNGTLTVTNISTGATAGPLTFTAATIVPVSGSGTFTVGPGTTGTPCTANLVVAAGSSCTLNIRYTPPAAPASVASTARVRVTDTGAATTSQTSPLPGFNGN